MGAIAAVVGIWLHETLESARSRRSSASPPSGKPRGWRPSRATAAAEGATRLPTSWAVFTASEPARLLPRRLAL